MTRTFSLTPLLLISLLALTACAGSQPVTRAPDQGQSRSPVALINGRAIEAAAISSSLFEIGGDQALREYALDRALISRCEQRGLRIEESQLERERDLLGESLGFAGGEALPQSVLDELRAQRGLGPVRFEQLLRRNAMLRGLVGDVNPTPEQLAQRIELEFGTGYRVRLFVSDSAEAANEARFRTMARGENDRVWVFAEQCARASLHPSADRGGLIRRVTSNAPGFPSAMLTSLSTTQPGACSNVLSTETGYLVIFVESIIPARQPDGTETVNMEQRLRMDLQRERMQQYAQQLLAEQEVIVTDRSLNWSWTNQR
jgi:hypothetical protein